MSFLPPPLQRKVDERTSDEQARVVRDDNPSAGSLEHLQASVRRELDLARQAQTVVEELGKLAMGSATKDYLVVALAMEHSTILGQIMAAVSKAVAPEYGIGEPVRYCQRPNANLRPGQGIIHADHDSRLTCETVIGATLARHQPII